MLVLAGLCETQNSRQILDWLQTDSQDTEQPNVRICEYNIINTNTDARTTE